MKKPFVLAAACAAALACLPLANLAADRFRPAEVFEPRPPRHPQFVRSSQLLQTACFACHAAGAQLPFYAALPPAKEIVRRDVRLGLEAMDLRESLFRGAPGEVTLAKIEFELAAGSMPPVPYAALHWAALLGRKDRELLISWIRDVRVANFRPEPLPDEIRRLPVAPLPSAVRAHAAKAALGERLFHDTRLSKDNSISCASCHALDKGGTDRAKTSTGIGGQIGPINSPTVFNSALNFVQFWDGRAKDLREQAPGPVHNPLEMGTEWKEVLPKLRSDADFARAFEAVYTGGLNGDNIAEAIAEFEKTLLTPGSRFDQYLHGKTAALSERERNGMRLFLGEGCASCHAGRNLGGLSFEKMGRVRDYFVDRGNPTEADKGRWNVTKKASDLHKFKVPSLRNIELTYPYLHDGSVDTLEGAVRTMWRYQTGKPLTEAETRDVAAFLRTLTGKYKGKPLT